MNSTEKRTGLGDLFVKKVIENNDYEYCNRSKAEAAAKLADFYAISFLEWYGEQSLSFVNGKSTKELLQMYKTEKGL